MKRKIIRILSVLLVMATVCQIMLAGCGQQTNTGDKNKENITGDPEDKTGVPKDQAYGLLITEAFLSNGNTFADSDGWIELYNASDSELSLYGVVLSVTGKEQGSFPLPAEALPAGAYLTVYAPGADAAWVKGDFCASFVLCAGDRILLTKNGAQIDALDLPRDLPDGISYGLIGDAEGFTRVYFSEPTPGKENGGRYAEVLSELELSDQGLRINEFLMKNVAVLFDEDGDCPDWAEIRNCSDKPCSLGGFGLSDSFADRHKWRFPDIVLGAGEYIVVLLSGKEKPYIPGTSAYLHANFKLSENDDGLILTSPSGSPVDRIAAVSLPENVSYGRDPQDLTVWKFFERPTPGKENDTAGSSSLEAYLASQTQKVYINEVCAVSSSTVSGLPKEDWIELYNGGAEDIDLSGWSLGKHISDLRAYTFPSVTLRAHGYLVVRANGVVSTDPKKLSVGFKIKFTGNTIYLTDRDGYLADLFETGYQRAGVTSGRAVENGRLVRRFFPNPSEGAENILAGSAPAYAQPAIISSDGQSLCASRHTVTISAPTPGAEIFYTLDGTLPTKESFRYTAPITLDKSTSVRAAVYTAGLLPSEVSTKTFLCDEPHKLGVVCLTTDPDNLFGYDNGIWANGPGWTEKSPHKGANYWKEWERPVYFEYYDQSGAEGISFPAGIKNHGQYSRAKEQKSVSINLKEAYGSSTSSYPFFGEDDLSVFDNLLLRTGSQDWNYTNLMDVYCERVVRGQMDLDLMRDLPVAVYVNGEYWGLYFIRDKINESYVYHNRGIEEDNLDMIKGTTRAETGTADAHKALLHYVNTHDLSNREYFDYVASQIDLEEWSNYWITETFFANTDTGNIRFYCPRDGSGKWRWILFDLDWALYPSTYTWNMLKEFTHPEGHGVHRYFSTEIAVALFKNEDFKERFVRKYAGYMHSTLSVERLIAVLEETAAEIAPEMPRQCARWGALTMPKWEKNINKLKTILEERWEKSVIDLQKTFRLSDAQMKELFPEKYS